MGREESETRGEGLSEKERMGLRGGEWEAPHSEREEEVRSHICGTTRKKPHVR